MGERPHTGDFNNTGDIDYYSRTSYVVDDFKHRCSFPLFTSMNRVTAVRVQ